MAGFLRRLRRPKDGELAEESPPADEEPLPEESMDGSEVVIPFQDPAPADEMPAVTPEADPPEPAVAALPDEPTVPLETPPTPPSAPVGPTGPMPTLPAPDPTPIAPEVSVGPPPPLPEADRDAATSSLSGHRTGTACFLCATEMQGTYCPTCRMDWNE